MTPLHRRVCLASHPERSAEGNKHQTRQTPRVRSLARPAACAGTGDLPPGVHPQPACASERGAGFDYTNPYFSSCNSRLPVIPSDFATLGIQSNGDYLLQPLEVPLYKNSLNITEINIKTLYSHVFLRIYIC